MSRIIHGDNATVLPYLCTIGTHARLVLTDPPYGDVVDHAWDKSGEVTDEWCEAVKWCMTDDASLYVWCGIGEKSQSLIEFFPVLSRHFHFKDLITWKKRRGIGMRRGWLYTREECLWFVRDNKNFVWNKDAQYSDEPNAFKVGMSGTPVNDHKRIPNVWTDIPEPLALPTGAHPCTKPAMALERIILAHTAPGDVVLDPFCGGGSAIRVADLLGRYGIGIERDGHWAAYAQAQLDDLEEWT